jgi:hypothetical protein
MIEKRKYKSLFNMTIDKCQIGISISHHPNTERIGITTMYTYRKEYRNDHKLIRFFNKQVSTDLPKVKSGYVRHHIIYDHLNTSDYTIELSRSDHTKLHLKMKHNGIEISHINVRVNDIHGF